MNHSKLLLAAALSAAAWSSASQAQTVLYGVEYYGNSTGTGTTPSESNWSAYPSHPANIGYAVSEYWDNNGVLRQKADPVVIDTQGTATYMYPDTARLVYPSSTVIYTTSGVDLYLAPTWDSRYKNRSRASHAYAGSA